MLSVIALLACLLPAGPRAFAAGSPVGAADGRFRYEGRIDFSAPAAPVLIWAGTRVSLDFDGAALALRFTGATGQNYFNAEMDGMNTVVAANPDTAGRIALPVAGAGRHHLVLLKRTEGAKGTVRFLGVELAAGAQAWAPAVPAYRLRMEFIGDSITVGACDEDGAEDQWSDFRTHNHALSYDWLTSQALHADHRAMAVSGMGISAGWVDVRAGQVWDRVYPAADAPRADLAAWQPDVVLVNLGENDFSFTRHDQQPLPAGYTPGYVALVQSIRAAYPHAHVVLLRGGMFGGARDPGLRAAWEAAVRELEADGAPVSHFVFTHWSTTHPRVADHRAMADELLAWLRQQPFMQKFL